jgi:hypothetical protein
MNNYSLKKSEDRKKRHQLKSRTRGLCGEAVKRAGRTARDGQMEASTASRFYVLKEIRCSIEGRTSALQRLEQAAGPNCLQQQQGLQRSTLVERSSAKVLMRTRWVFTRGSPIT